MVWPRASLAEVAVAIKDGTHGTHVRVEDGVPLLSAKNITSDGRVVWDQADSMISESDYEAICRGYRLAPGDLLLTIVGSLGRRALYSGGKVAFQRSVAFIRSDPAEVAPTYLFHATGHADFQKQLIQRSNATAQAGLYLGELGQTVVPLPPLHEQRRIAAILDTLDEAIRKAEDIIAKLTLIKKGLLHDVLTRGIDECGELRPAPDEAPHLYRKSPIGRLPEDWGIRCVGEEFEIQLGKMLSSAARTGSDPRQYLGNRAVQWDRVDVTGLPEMDFSARERVKFRLLPNDLLVCEGGEVGRTALWRAELEECYFQKAIHRLRPLRGYDPRMMLAYMRHAALSGAFVDFTSQTSIAHLTQEKLASLPMPVPEREEQERIADAVETITNRVNREDTQLAKVRSMRSGLAGDLLAGRVRVCIPEGASA
jgi:type I restriction enzyme, S subunit